jgi:hypothetical protein
MSFFNSLSQLSKSIPVQISNLKASLFNFDSFYFLIVLKNMFFLWKAINFAGVNYSEIFSDFNAEKNLLNNNKKRLKSELESIRAD